MEVNNSLQNRISAAQFLIKHGTQKKITMSYCGSLAGYVEREYGSGHHVTKKHRVGTHWLRGDSSYMGVRALRLMKKILGEKVLDKPLNGPEFVSLCNTYFTNYPQDDEMTTNRMHYLIQAIRCGEVVVHKRCGCCHHQYITHRDEAHKRVCFICEK